MINAVQRVHLISVKKQNVASFLIEVLVNLRSSLWKESKGGLDSLQWKMTQAFRRYKGTETNTFYSEIKKHFLTSHVGQNCRIMIVGTAVPCVSFISYWSNAEVQPSLEQLKAFLSLDADSGKEFEYNWFGQKRNG